MAQKKYASLTTLQNLVDNIKSHFVKKEDFDTALSDKADLSHPHTTSEISDLTATATELNHLNGVTSNVQAQLDDKTVVQIITWGVDG